MLYGVVGEGSGNKAEITRTLEDLRDKASATDEDFWFLILAKEDPTATDKVVLKWLQDTEVWFDVVGDESDVYEGAQTFHGAKDPMRKMHAMLTEHKDEPAILLALYVDAEGEAPEDEDLAMLVERVIEEEIPVHLLNGQMIRLTFGEDEEGETEVEAEEGEAESFTEAELKKMTVPELTAIARGQGIAVKGLGKGDLITALLSPEDVPDEPPAPAKKAAAKSTAKKAPAEDAGEIYDDSTTPLLDAVGEAVNGASVIIVVDGTVTVLPVSIGRARAIIQRS